MEKSFWHQRWENNEIAFHQREVNPLLITYFEKLSLHKGSRVFVPLCGKTLDISWLLQRGYRVVGIELHEKAVEQLFEGLGLIPKIITHENHLSYNAENITIFVGDFFTLTSQLLGLVDAIYDRAALVALPDTMRSRYANHLMSVSNRAPQLLICYSYDQSQMPGPPFSICNEEVTQRYQAAYRLELLKSAEVPGGLKGKCIATENVWLLEKPARS